jgi:hypothetical protein
MSSYANDRTRIGDDPDELTGGRTFRVPARMLALATGRTLTHENAPDLATALAGLLDCCEEHDDELSEGYQPHDPDPSCMVCVARAALARHRGERFPPADDDQDQDRARVLSLKPGDAFRVEDGTVWRVCYGPDVPGHYNAVGAGDIRATIAVTRIVACL